MADNIYGKYSALETFRENHKKFLKQISGSGVFMKEMPKGVKDLFSQFLLEGATGEDILELLNLLAQEDANEWDSIEHYFL